MPWTQNGGSGSGGGGGGWKGGSGGPWGPGPGGSNPPPDLEELLRRSQDKLRQAVPGGTGFLGTVLVILVMLGAIGYFGFTARINTAEQAVVLRFGKFDRVLPPGIHFRWPFPVEDVYAIPVKKRNQVEVGFSTGLSGPYGTLRNPNKPEESLMLTGDENIVDINFNVFWNVKDPAAYLFSMYNPSTNPDANVTVKAASESSMREIVGKNDIQPILTKSRKEIEEAVTELIQKTLDGYNSGIHIMEVNLQKVDPPSDVIAAFQDVQAARADQERARNEAETYANRVIPEARGKAQQLLQDAQGYREQSVAEATGRTQRFLKVYQEYQKAPEVTRRRIYLETMERVLGGMDKTILDEKAAGTGVIPYLQLGGQQGGQR
jgi:modulator of FtsH protease HflK